MVGDLARLRVDLPSFGVTKAAGEAGRMTATLLQPDERHVGIDAAAASWGAVSLRGSGAVRIAPFVWDKVRIDELRSPVAELDATLAQAGGTITATAHARRFDLQPWRNRKGEGTDEAGDLVLDFKADRLFYGPEPLENVTLLAERRGAVLVEVKGGARLPGGGSATFDLAGRTLPGVLAMETSNLAGLLRGLDVRKTGVQGGRGRVNGTIESRGGARVWTGEAKLRELVLRDAPLIAKLLSLASLQGIASTLSGSGLAIERVTIPFTWTGDRVELKQARAVGSALGARVDGSVDLKSRQLDLEGTVAPLYAVTRFIGRIPLVGDLLRGEKADAAFAATFRVGGSLDDPQISVNPLAALVPGVIRDLFGDLAEGMPEGRRPSEPRD
jgi:hypothetical protein